LTVPTPIYVPVYNASSHRYSVTLTEYCNWRFNWRCGPCTVWDW